MVKIILLDLNRMAVICIINFANGNIYIYISRIKHKYVKNTVVLLFNIRTRLHTAKYRLYYLNYF